MPEYNPQEKLRKILLAMEAGEMQDGDDLEVLRLLSSHPELRPEYLQFIQYMAIQHQVNDRFERKNHFSELEGLMRKQIESGLNEDEEVQLNKCLASSNRARAYYLESCQVDAMLKQSLGGLIKKQDSQLIENRPKIEDVKSNQNPWRLALIAASVLLALETIVFLTYLNSSSQPTENKKEVVVEKPTPFINASVSLASVLDSRGAKLNKFDKSMKQLRAGKTLKGGAFELTDGLLKLGFEGGATVVMEAPAKFELINAKTMKLLNGKVSADVPEAAIGFTIDTPTSEVVDLGTSFAVEVNSSGKDEIHVFDGEVVVKNKSIGNKESLHLFENQALRMDLATHTPANIDVDHRRFLRQIKEGTNNYSKLMLSLNPMFYLNMAPSFDGLSMYDMTGHGYDAQAVNYDEQKPKWAPGVFGMAAEFGGPGTKWGYIIPNFPKIDTGSFTVMAWIYAKSRPQWASIAKNWFIKKGQFHFGLKEMTGKLEGHIYNEAEEKEIFVMDSEVLPLNQWHHVVMSAGGGKMRLYRNGKMVDIQDIPGLFHNPKFDWISIGAKIAIGKEESSTEANKFVITDREHIKGSYWDGMIDELSLFNRVLADEEIENLHQLGREHIKKTVLN